MARITIEDCLKNIPNRFQLTLAATYRARQLLQGHTKEREAVGVRRDADRLGAFTDQIGQADIADLGHFDLQLPRDAGQVIGGHGIVLRRQDPRQYGPDPRRHSGAVDCWPGY